MKRQIYILFIATSVILLDQITKYLVSKYIGPLDSIEVFPFLHIVNLKNTGAAFGIFRDLSSNIFIGVSIIAIIFIILLLLKSNFNCFGLSLVFGGAIGNLIDRIRYGKVVDFIDFSIGKYHWPAFNVADSSLTIGITIILILSLIKNK